MQVPELIILILSCGLLLGIGGWAAIWGWRPKIPDGRRYDTKSGPYKVAVVFHRDFRAPEGLTEARIANACADAAYSIGTTWKKNHSSRKARQIRKTCVWFQDTTEFDRSHLKEIKTAAAYLSHTGANIGGGIPMAVVRDTYVEEVFTTGEPVIHEMIHSLLGEYSREGKDRDHSHHAWAAISKEKSIQALARKLYKTFVA